MPTFDFTSPDGKTYSVQGPDGATPEQAFQMLQQHIGEPQVGALEDAGKSIGSGLASATAGTLGAAGDLRTALSGATDWAGGKLGVGPDKVQAFKDMASKAANMAGPLSVLANAPTSRDIVNSAPDALVSPDYKPQTTLGGYLKTGAEFAPGMLMGGPENLGARFLTNVAAPAIGSETAGLLTKGSAAEPYARVGGALLGGAGASVAANKFKEMAAARSAAKSIPTTEDLLSTAGKQFEDVKASDLVVKPAAVEAMAKDIKTELLNNGFHPDSGNQKGVFSALDRLEQLGAQPGGVTPKDLEVVRKNLVSMKTDMDQSTAKAARDATSSFMDKYSNLGQADVLNGDTAKTFGTLKDAIGNYAAGKRSNTVMGKANLAQLNADTAGSGANVDNAYRQAIKQLVRPVNNDIVTKARRLGFNAAEEEALNVAARGTAGGNAARYIGKAAPTGIVSGAMSGTAGHAVGGPIGAVALPAIGFIAKKIGDLSTKRAVAAVDSLVRSRSPLAAQVAAQLPPQIVQQLSPKTAALLASLIAADPVLSQSLAQQQR